MDEHDNVTCELYSVTEVLMLFDSLNSAETKDTIGSTLFPILCSFGFSLSMPAMSVQLRCSVCLQCPITDNRLTCRKVYSLLAESASLHKANQERLRAPSIAGG